LPPWAVFSSGGKGVLKEAARRVIPSAVIDRPKGYFPVPGITHLRGPSLDLVTEALRAPEAKARGLYRAEEVDRLIALAHAGREELTPLRGNKLWQLGLLELWLQAQGA
jgi:asparagine synthase (glutamine-hydrolysing)